MTNRGFVAAILAVFCAAFLADSPASAQSSHDTGYGVGNIHEGLVIGAIVGIGAVAGLAIAFVVLHNRGVVEGCITQSDGATTLVREGKTVYSLSSAGPSLPAGDRAKLKGHKSGRASSPSFQVE